MARYIIIRDYHTYKEVQKIKVKSGGSITFKPEWVGEKKMMVIRDYHTNNVIQKATIKTTSSYEFFCREQ